MRLPGIAGGAVGVIDADAAVITAQYTPRLRAGGAWPPAAARCGSPIRRRRDRRRASPARATEITIIPVGAQPGRAGVRRRLAVGGRRRRRCARPGRPGAEPRRAARSPIGNGLRAWPSASGPSGRPTALDGEVVRFDLRSGSVVEADRRRRQPDRDGDRRRRRVGRERGRQRRRAGSTRARTSRWTRSASATARAPSRSGSARSGSPTARTAPSRGSTRRPSA